ncbi:MAG: rRNA maturation RNase YbeY [Deltaproteobacteria bacterium]|nr:rRNA maturation RNase YbeY [Deltaproteobacteria bacterium]
MKISRSSCVFVTGRKGLARYRKTAKDMALAVLEELDVEGKELSVLLTDDKEIRALNQRYRGLDKATDVLSFPMDDPQVMGDVVISVDAVSRQASAYGKGLEQELARLIIHGILHLLGYDHVKGTSRAASMRSKEKEILEVFNLRGLGGKGHG